MKLWILWALRERGYEETYVMVIRAENEQAARQLAAEEDSDDEFDENMRLNPRPNQFWLDPTMSSCEWLTQSGERGVIIEAW